MIKLLFIAALLCVPIQAQRALKSDSIEKVSKHAGTNFKIFYEGAGSEPRQLGEALEVELKKAGWNSLTNQAVRNCPPLLILKLTDTDKESPTRNALIGLMGGLVESNISVGLAREIGTNGGPACVQIFIGRGELLPGEKFQKHGKVFERMEPLP